MLRTILWNSIRLQIRMQGRTIVFGRFRTSNHSKTVKSVKDIVSYSLELCKFLQETLPA